MKIILDPGVRVLGKRLKTINDNFLVDKNGNPLVDTQSAYLFSTTNTLHGSASLTLGITKKDNKRNVAKLKGRATVEFRVGFVKQDVYQKLLDYFRQFLGNQPSQLSKLDFVTTDIIPLLA